MSNLRTLTLVLLATVFIPLSAQVARGQVYLQTDGIDDYVEAPDSDDFSIDTTGGLTIGAWMKPGALYFPTPEGSGYVHWLGKGGPRQHEWTFRMYSRDNTEDRGNRISFYVFNPDGGLGVGSYFQDPITAGEWIHVVGVADSERAYIYKNGVLRDSDRYAGAITSRNGTAPLRMGTRDLRSYFLGGLAEVRVWNRPLTAEEIADWHAFGIVPRDGLVAEWLLNEEVGTIARDTTGAHDGAISGGYRPVR